MFKKIKHFFKEVKEAWKKGGEEAEEEIKEVLIEAIKRSNKK